MSLARFVQRHRVVGFRNYKRNFVLVNLGKECAKTRSDELPFRMDLARRGIWIEVVQLLPALSRIRILSVIVLLAVTLTSCVAPKEEKDANGKKIEYVYYTPTGSSIPIRVPKDSLQLTDSEAAAQQKEVTDLQRESADDKSPGTR
jgi:hypothetical protein